MPRPCPDASNFRLGNIKQTQKQEPAMRVLGWVTEAASKYWDCISPVAMATKTGWILAERERKNTGKTMSPRRLSECVCLELLVRVEGAEPRKENRWKRTFQYRFVLGAQRAPSPLHTSMKHISESPSETHADPKNTAMRWGSLLLLGRWQNQSSLYQVPRYEIHSACLHALGNQ